MNTLKEKAKEFVEKFYKFANSIDFDSVCKEYFTNNELCKNNAKHCALICVDEILNELEHKILEGKNHLIYKYWLEFKQEIEKL